MSYIIVSYGMSTLVPEYPPNFMKDVGLHKNTPEHLVAVAPSPCNTCGSKFTSHQVAMFHGLYNKKVVI